MRYLPLLFILLISCRATKTVQRASTTVDSTVYRENRMLKEAIEGMSHTIESLSTDSQGVTVQFDTLTIRDTITRNIVKFKDGKIIYAEGNIRKVQAQAARSESLRDSLQTLAYELQDSIGKLKASKTVETKTVYKQVKRGSPWFWFCMGLVGGWVIRWKLWPWVRKLIKYYV